MYQSCSRRPLPLQCPTLSVSLPSIAESFGILGERIMTTQILGCVLIVAAPALKPPKNETPLIVGLWMLTEYTQNGAPLGFEEGTSTEFCADGKRLWTEGRQLAMDHERGFRLIPKSSPPALDLTRSTDKPDFPDVFPCI
jgi:hypothetical protein